MKHVSKCAVSSLFQSSLPGFDFWCRCSCGFFFSIKATFSQILDVNELRWMEVNSTAAAAATFLTFYLQIVGLPSNLKGQSHLGKHLTLPHVFILFQPGAAQKAVTQQSGEVYGRQIWILLLC